MRMIPEVRARFDGDLRAARAAVRSGDVATAWSRLEDAHVVSQPWAMAHLRTHALMFALAVRTRDLREIGGQLIRIVVAAPGSASGRYPVGNTGRSDVSMFAPMPLAPDVAELFDER